MVNSKIKVIELQGENELRISKSILEQLPFKPMGRFLVLQGKDFITFKKVDEVPAREKFADIAKRVQKKAKTLKINKRIVDEAIAWARKKS